jgi:hypothetical protein
MERTTLPPHERKPVFVHIDEMQTFSSDAFASLFSEARKFATYFSAANQFTAQLSDRVRAAIIGNAGTLVVFRVGSEDAALLAPEFAVGTLGAGLRLSPENQPVVAGDLVSPEPLTAWMRRGLQRDHVFIEPKHFPQFSNASLIREQSRQRFGRSRGAIECDSENVHPILRHNHHLLSTVLLK